MRTHFVYKPNIQPLPRNLFLEFKERGLYKMIATEKPRLVGIMDAEPNKIASAMTVYIWQLVVNFLWPTFFFNFCWYLFSFIWLLLLWVLVLITTIRFWGVSKAAGLLMIPYFVWTTFACYLNFGVWYLNR